MRHQSHGSSSVRALLALAAIPIVLLSTSHSVSAQVFTAASQVPSVQTQLRPGDSVSGDAFGKCISISGDVALVCGGDKAYFFERNAVDGSWPLVSEVPAGPIELSGDTAIGWCGTSFEGDDRNVCIYERHHGGADAWGRVVALAPLSPQFAVGVWSLALSGDTAVVAYGGFARIFERNEGGADAWGFVTRIQGPALIVEAPPTRAVIDGDTLVLGIMGPLGLTAAGSVAVFERSSGDRNTWTRVAAFSSPDCTSTATPPCTPMAYGVSVGLSGDTFVVADPIEGLFRYHVYERDPATGAWGLVTTLRPRADMSDHCSPANVPDSCFDVFGSVRVGLVAISGDTIAIPANNRDRYKRKPVYVFRRNQGGSHAWGEAGVFTPVVHEYETHKLTSPVAGLSELAPAARITSDTILVGASRDQVAPFAGRNTAGPIGAAFVCPLEALAVNDGVCRRGTPAKVNALVTSSDVHGGDPGFDPAFYLNHWPFETVAPGTFYQITATFTNTSHVAISDPIFEIATLSGGTVLFDTMVLDEDDPFIPTTFVRPTDLGGDHVIEPGETVPVTFLLGLVANAPFRFLVNLNGYPMP